MVAGNMSAYAILRDNKYRRVQAFLPQKPRNSMAPAKKLHEKSKGFKISRRLWSAYVSCVSYPFPDVLLSQAISRRPHCPIFSILSPGLSCGCQSSFYASTTLFLRLASVPPLIFINPISVQIERKSSWNPEERFHSVSSLSLYYLRMRFVQFLRPARC